MSHTSRLRRMPDTFRQLTGITPDAFDQLLAELEPRYPQADAKRKKRPSRQRKPGAGRKFARPLSDRLLMLLMYYRTYTTHAFLGFLFGIDDRSVCRNISDSSSSVHELCQTARAALRRSANAVLYPAVLHPHN